jgi:spermidine/putrescine transport system substrate-binding protein
LNALTPRDPIRRHGLTAGRAQYAAFRPTRRNVLAGFAGAAGLGALAGCAAPAPPPAATASSAGASASIWLAPDRSDSEKLVRFSNWTEYLDRSEDNKSYPSLLAFSKATGIAVDYTENIDDNDTYVAKVAPLWRARKDFGADLVVLSDWMVNRIMTDQLAAPLDHSRIPNAKNVLTALHDVSYDPGRRYSLPWQSGFAGLAYNRKKLGRDLRTVADLWAPDLKGRVTLLSEMRDTVGLIMLAQGTDVSKPFDKTAMERGFDEVRRRIADGYVRRVRGNSYIEDFKSGNAVAGFAWSGDIFSLRSDLGTQDWQFVMPESGGILWSDTALIPVTTPHRANAERLLDYYYDPAVAAQVAAYVNYICPVQGAQAAMEKIDPALATSPFIFPTADYLATYAKEFRALSPTEDADYSATWAKVVGN